MNCIDFTCRPCDTFPEASFSICAPQLILAQVSEVYLTKPGHGFLDVDNATEWATRMLLPARDPSRIVKLSVIGEKPAGTRNTVTGAYNQTEGLNKTIQLRFTILECNDSNYEVMRFIEKNRRALGWYGSGGGKLYGGNPGLLCLIDIDQDIVGSFNDVEKITGTLTFYAVTHPCRTDAVV